MYNEKIHLKWHVQSVHLKVEKTHKCNQCGKFFLDETLLKGRDDEENKMWYF